MMWVRDAYRRCAVAGLLVLLLAPAGPAAAQVAVTTHHYDTFRTGWNARETTLTHAALDPASGLGFGLRRTVALDAQVDAQPLVMPSMRIVGDPNPAPHDVVYVATEGNSVYAIDPTTGTVLARRQLGAAVPMPLRCPNNDATVGINATPVIDPATGSLYVIAYTQQPAGPAYTLHRLALRDLSDIVPPRAIAASGTLSDGSRFAFDAAYQRQRAALLLKHGTVYAGFASFCDYASDHSRGWVLGWDAATLAPMRLTNGGTFGELLNTRVATPNSFFLASVWMSGAGLAADGPGHVFLVTGNSDRASSGFADIGDLQESVVKLWPADQQVVSKFTPANVARLDRVDLDFGAGGVVLLPRSLPGLPPRLAVAAGKSGTMYLLNRDRLGGFAGAAGPDRVVGSAQIGQCWCEPTVFDAGGPTIVSSGGHTLQLWSLAGDPTAPLLAGPQADLPQGAQDGGFFTSVSSNGHADPVVWAVGRPTAADPANIKLYGYRFTRAPGRLERIAALVAGTWPNVGGNANIVPVVANGRVYVASYRQLAIFGLAGE